ncbi:hypothetical protein CDIK_2287 [Cucumispora dikerogammari]|nr:hypothetical protein CDIK_2287 [Cucumispora dikerogammari]
MWRRLQAEELSCFYKENKSFRDQCKMLFCLLFVNLKSTHETYTLIKPEFLKFQNQERIFNFLRYFENTYLGTNIIDENTQSQFSNEDWSVYYSIKNTYLKSNNTAKAFHSKISKMIQISHLNIAYFIKTLFNIEKSDEIKIEQFRNSVNYWSGKNWGM